MIRAFALIAALIVLATPPPPVGAAACVGRKGKLTSRAACRKSERPLDATAVSPVGPTGQAGVAGKPGGFPLAIVDAGDRELGTILSLDFGTALVAVNYPGFPSPVGFAVDPSGFTNLGTDVYAFVAYTQTGCSGQPHLPAHRGAYAHVEGSVAYLPSGSAGSISFLSYEIDDFTSCATPDLTGRGTCCIAAPFTGDYVPAVRIAFPDFTPPFRSVLR